MTKMISVPALSLFWATVLAFILSTTLATTPPSSFLTRRDENNDENDEKDGNISVFVQQTVYGNISFAVTAVKETGDLYFHLEAPGENSWVGIGVGRAMSGSLVWVAYRTGDDHGVTLSPRLATSHIEPTYNPEIPCVLSDEAGDTPGGIVEHDGHNIYVVNVRCRDINRRASFGGKALNDAARLDFDSTAHPFIFAVGPTDRHLHDDDKEAGIRRHSMYGSFTLDLRSASVNTSLGVDQRVLSTIGNWQLKNAKLTLEPQKDLDWGGPIHSLMMCGAFVVLFPVGVIFLRVLEKVRWHAIMQGVGLGVVAGGVGMGVWVGREYNQSQQIRSPHQIIGLTVFSLTLVQFGLGLAHHLIYLRKRTPTFLGRMHAILGPLLLVVGAANGFLGFRFSGGSYHNILYGAIVFVAFAVLAGLLVWRGKRKARKVKMRGGRRVMDEAYEAFKHQEPRRQNVRDGDARGSFDDDEIPLRELPPGESSPGQVPLDGPPAYESVRTEVPRSLV